MSTPADLQAALKTLSDRGLRSIAPDVIDRVGAQLGDAISGLTPMEAIAVLAGTLNGLISRYAPNVAQSRGRTE